MARRPRSPSVALLALLAVPTTAWSQPTVTRIEAIENLEGVPFSHAGKGKEYLRLFVTGMTGPCLRAPGDFRMVDAEGKSAKAISVSFTQPAGSTSLSSCDSFVATFSPTKRGMRPAVLRVKETEVDAAKLPVRIELYEAYVAGSIALVVTPVDSGKAYQAVIRNLTDAPLSLAVAERTGAFIVKEPLMFLVLLEPSVKDLDLPARGEAPVRFSRTYGRGSEQWKAGTVTLLPVPEK